MIGAIGGSYSYYPVYNRFLNKDNMKVHQIEPLKRDERPTDKLLKTST